MNDEIFVKAKRVHASDDFYWIRLSQFNVVAKYHFSNKIVGKKTVALLKKKDSDGHADSYMSELDYDTFIRTYLEKSEELNSVGALTKN